MTGAAPSCCVTAAAGIVPAQPVVAPEPRPLRLALRPFLVGAILWLGAYLATGPLSRLLAHDLLGLTQGSRLGSAVAFFALEVPRVLLLLVAVVFLVGVVNTWFTAERTRRILVGRREAVGNVLAALLGVVT